MVSNSREGRIAYKLTMLVLVIAVVATTNVSMTAAQTSDCKAQHKAWQGWAPHKAMALSRIVGSRQACGFAGGAKSKKQATEAALRQCQIAAQRSNLGNPRCRVVEAH